MQRMRLYYWRDFILSERKEKVIHVLKLIGENFVRLLFFVLFVSIFQMIFGVENTLAVVAASVAITMYPVMDTGLKPLAMCGVIIGLFLGSGIAAELSVLSPWLALPVHFLFVVAVMVLCGAPLEIKTFICFLLSFVFCQSTPVPLEEFPKRMLCLLTGSVLTAACTLVWWKHKGYGANGISIRQQIHLSAKNKGLILRMAAGISVAMFTASMLGLKKPLWLSIVVMSLTQLQFNETLTRIKHRAFGTVVGVLVFVVVFQLLVPKEYSMLFILLMSYVSFFTPEYKYKQIVNAVCALNASLVLLDTTTAIENRVLCLLGGIAIVLLMHLLEKLVERVIENLPYFRAVVRSMMPGREQESNGE